MKLQLLAITFILFTFPTIAAPYNVIKDNSKIKFSGTHAGNEFTGQFTDWNADIDFDVNDVNNSSVTVTFNTASAKTGNAMYDGTLPTADWFDSKNHPEAKFHSTSFKKTDDGFAVTGDLTIRDITNPVTFDFVLEGDNPTIMSANFSIDRLQFDIGRNSDSSAEWVSQNITIDLEITASQK